MIKLNIKNEVSMEEAKYHKEGKCFQKEREEELRKKMQESI